MDISKKRILVTGGGGFLGQYVLQTLHVRGCIHVFSPSSSMFDLRKDYFRQHVFAQYKPEIVIHMAAILGGIGAHAGTQGQFLYENLVMGLEMMELARQWGVEKFVNIGTACSYPDVTPKPVKEEHMWDGFPNKTTAPYGLAKRVMMYQGQMYREQYGMNNICVIPANVYGPNDHFDPKISHVIPSIITNCVEAKKNKSPLVIWGTGKATREFIYASDCADGIVKATEDYDKPEPVNLGTGVETSIRELVNKIITLMKFEGEVVWDASKPDGNLGRVFDVTKAQEEFGFKADIGLDEGLCRTVYSRLRDLRRTHGLNQ